MSRPTRKTDLIEYYTGQLETLSRHFAREMDTDRLRGGAAYWVHETIVGVDESAGWIYFTALEASSVERQLYRIRADGSGMTRVSSEPGAHRISMSRDARHYLDAFSDVRTLPSLSLRRVDGTRVAQLSTPRMSVLERFDVQFPELTRITTSDGFLMPAQFLKPKDFSPARKYPVILFVYGGRNAPTVVDGDWQRNTLYDQLLARAGYVVMRVDHTDYYDFDPVNTILNKGEMHFKIGTFGVLTMGSTL